MIACNRCKHYGWWDEICKTKPDICGNAVKGQEIYYVNVWTRNKNNDCKYFELKWYIRTIKWILKHIEGPKDE
jgi:hypothetical protein